MNTDRQAIKGIRKKTVPVFLQAGIQDATTDASKGQISRVVK